MTTAFNAEQIQEHLIQIPDWIMKNGLLERTFTFSNYADGVAFALQVATLSESINHHPDSLEIGWKKVRVAYVTHDAGGITPLDFAAATKVSSLSL